MNGPVEDGGASTAPPEADKALDAAPRKPGIGQYFRWRPLPWWITFALGVFCFFKLQIVYNDSPCAVLGTQSPVSMADVKKAFRTLSMCTHPDRLRGRLKRQPTDAESRRGEMVFKRASAAKDDLTAVLKNSKKKSVACYEGEIELMILKLVSELGQTLVKIGVRDYMSMAWDSAWSLLSLKHGILNTLFATLWLAFVFRIVKQFVMYLWRLGIINFTVSVVTTIIIGPVPTVVHFFILPVVRLGAFVMEASGLRPPKALERPAEDPPAVASANGQGQAQPTEVTMNSTAHRPVASDEAPRLRQRKKKETPEDKERRNKELLTGSAESTAAAGNDPTHGAGPMPDTLWSVVNWSHSNRVKARQEAANAVQFDFLLVTTKPIIPLFMLLALGQVWNGLISSLIIGHALRKWVPQMSHEAHHLLCAFFGAIHTLLGVSAKQVEDYANSTGGNVLHLAWSIGFKDILAIMHMCFLGATVTAMSALGNEPSYAASFAAGLALRIAIAQDSIQGISFIRTAAAKVDSGLRDVGFVMDSAEEVVAYSGGGIGDCGGGPFRMLFGDGPEARWAALGVKAWLMLLPALSALQWLQRSVHAGRNLGKRYKTMRFIQRVALCLLGLQQCFFLGQMELNASNGALDNFWLYMLIGCVWESLLCTYDIRGPVRQIFFLLLFLVI